MLYMSESRGNPLMSVVWALENQARTPIPNLNSLDTKKIAEGSAPGIYTLVGPNDTRAYLTVHANGAAELWNLNYDPEYLARAYAGEGLNHLGKKVLPSKITKGEGDSLPPISRGWVASGQRCKHGNVGYCHFCRTGIEPSVTPTTQ